jgi:uncharacterized repeat protein (TIGR03803 family)
MEGLLSTKAVVLRVGLFALLGLLCTLPAAAGSNELVLYSFRGNDGTDSLSNLISDSAGNLYGTTCCNAFVLIPQPKGRWKKKVLHWINGSFSGLVFDSSGNLYGTTQAGGSNKLGTVFELSPGPAGIWTRTTLHQFDGTKGAKPFASLVFDESGNLYGTASAGGTDGCGVVFRMTPQNGGKWTTKVLHTFAKTEGCGPSGALILDSNGNLYGTASSGGTSSGCGSRGCGVVFELSKSGSDWTYSTLYNFNGNDGDTPRDSLIFDTIGNLYGTTWQGGSGFGAVFELSSNGTGQWTETVLHNFSGADGANPYAGLILDSSGVLYGTTSQGGKLDCGSDGCGTVFKLTPNPGSGWTETVLNIFKDLSDGGYPYGGLLRDKKGALYGTTFSGGVFNRKCRIGCGVIYKIAP